MSEGVLGSFIRDVLTKTSHAKAPDEPQTQRIDGNGHYYPNCAADVWLRSCECEIIEPIEGQISGTIPAWLSGSLLRNGPGNWHVGEMTFDHLFDCSALLHRFAIHNQNVTYQTRYIKTETLKRNTAAQRIVVTEFGTSSVPDPCHSIFDKVSALFRPDRGSDNTMISIYPFGDEYYTFTESPIMHKINPRTLETEARVCVGDYVGVVNHTSHPHVVADGTVYNLGIVPAKSGPTYTIICFPHGEHMLEDAHLVASVPCRWKLNPAYMHTFGLTEHYFVIVEQPLSISLTDYLRAHFNNGKLCACLKWFNDKPTLFQLVDRKTGKLMYTFEAEPFFYLHIVNQYEEDDHVIIDICCYKDPEMINYMYLEAIANMQTNPNYATLFRGRPMRFVLPLRAAENVKSIEKFKSPITSMIRSLSLISMRLQRPSLRHSESQPEDFTYLTNDNNNYESDITGKTKINNTNKGKDLGKICHRNLVSLSNTKAEAYYKPDGTSIHVRPELLCDLGCETPRINYDRYLGTKYRYFYAISSDVDAENPGTLIKVDVVTKTCQTWCETNCYPSEPIFVPNPNSLREDDGIILASIVWGGVNDNMVGLLVLNAQSMTEMGRAVFRTKSPVPKCLHGWFAEHVV